MNELLRGGSDAGHARSALPHLLLKERVSRLAM